MGTRFLIRRSGDIVGTIGGGLFEAEVQQFAATCLEERISRRNLFCFTGKDASALEMICGGEAEVLVEFVDGKDSGSAEVYRLLESITASRASGYALTLLEMPLEGNQTEPVKHLVVDGSGRHAGFFPGCDAAMKALPEARLLKQAQLLEVPGSPHPVLLEWLHPTATVYIFGSGHVGICVAHLAAYVDFAVVMIDDRSDFASLQRVPEADRVVVLESFADAMADLPIDEDSFIVIVTRGHAHDKTVLAQALKTKAGYIGMIGSRRKTHLIFEALLAEGYTPDDIQRVHAPIGLPIGGETPQEIGISIIAEMLQVRHQGRPKAAGGSGCCPA
jgi:xanthine dehydrogenase accessory factor